VSILKRVFRPATTGAALALILVAAAPAPALESGTPAVRSLASDQPPGVSSTPIGDPLAPVMGDPSSIVPGGNGATGPLDDLLAPVVGTGPGNPQPGNDSGPSNGTASRPPAANSSTPSSRHSTPRPNPADPPPSARPAPNRQSGSSSSAHRSQRARRSRARSSSRPRATRRTVGDGIGRPAAPHRHGHSPGAVIGALVEKIPPQYRIALIALAAISLLLAALTLRERRRMREVERQSLVDPLTGLPNRQAFERRLRREWTRSERYDRKLGLLLMDLDDFKAINDSRGHVFGDQVLQKAALTVVRRIRTTDMAARLGGDEFVVLCPETDAHGLKVLAESVEKRLHLDADISTSIGFTQREAGDIGPQDLIRRADSEMYRRKQGRGRRPDETALRDTPGPSMARAAAD
jgi:diguanylate cyclase (GGDEF)-like protein